MKAILLKLALVALVLFSLGSSAFAITAKPKTIIVAPPTPVVKPIKSGL